MNFAKRALQAVCARLDLPGDAAGAPCVTLCGFTECSVDCPCAIVEYEPHEIIAALPEGAVKIEGTALEVRQMRRDRLCVTGRIRAVTYLEDGV